MFVAGMGGLMLSDLKFACRQLRLNPGFTGIAVVTLALGLGATTAVFSFYNGMNLRWVPGVKDPHQLLFPGARHWHFSHPGYEFLRNNSTVFAELGAAARTPA